MSEKIICTKCGVQKDKEEFWFDNRRGAVRNPCKDCSNEQKRFKRKLNYANNNLTSADVERYVRMTGIKKDISEFLSAKIVLGRAITNIVKPKIKYKGDELFLFCPVCEDIQNISVPCEIINLITTLVAFNDLHRHGNVS